MLRKYANNARRGSVVELSPCERARSDSCCTWQPYAQRPDLCSRRHDSLCAYLRRCVSCFATQPAQCHNLAQNILFSRVAFFFFRAAGCIFSDLARRSRFAMTLISSFVSILVFNLRFKRLVFGASAPNLRCLQVILRNFLLRRSKFAEGGLPI